MKGPESAMQMVLVTLFPEMLEALTGFGVTARACEQGAVKLVPLTREILLITSIAR